MSKLFNKHTWLVLCVMSGIIITQLAEAASFDCAKAGTKVEHIICDTPEISKLDDELQFAYDKALKEASDSQGLVQLQRNWMRLRNECANPACLESKYLNRIDYFGKLSTTSTSSEIVAQANQRNVLDFRLRNDNGWAVCYDMIMNLNSMQPDIPSFATELVFNPKMKQFSWPDWQELNVLDYLDVVYEIENELMHLRPPKTMPFEEWKKKYLANIQAGAAGDFAVLARASAVWRPRLRMASVRLEKNGRLETVLGYVRNRDEAEWQKGIYTACPPEYGSHEIEQRVRECRRDYINRMNYKSLTGLSQGDHIFFFISETRSLRPLNSGRDPDGGASSVNSEHLFLHNGSAYLGFADITAMQISRVKRKDYSRPGWSATNYVSTSICDITAPYPRNSKE